MKKDSLKNRRKQKNSFLRWTPRILSIVFILFISLFSLDVFEEYSGWEILVALFMHLIPSIVLVSILLIAWKWELVGGVIYIIMGIVFTLFFKTYTELLGFFLISLPWIIVGILFIVNHFKSNKNIKSK